MQIVNNVWQVGGAESTSPKDAAIYLVRFGDAAALIDAGSGSAIQRLFENIAQVLPDSVSIQYLLLTHCHFDHAGGAESVRKRYGCKVAVHELDAVYLESGDKEVTAASWYGGRMQPLAIDYKITGRQQKIRVGSGEVTAYHCPGHSPGSAVYLAEVDCQRVLFGQDIHGPLHSDLLSDSMHYRRSLQAIIDLNADILCEGHFGIFRGHDEINRFIRSYL